jgi:hypothetical protein
VECPAPGAGGLGSVAAFTAESPDSHNSAPAQSWAWIGVHHARRGSANWIGGRGIECEHDALDMYGADCVEVQIDRHRSTLWVNTREGSLLRLYGMRGGFGSLICGSRCGTRCRNMREQRRFEHAQRQLAAPAAYPVGSQVAVARRSAVVAPPRSFKLDHQTYGTESATARSDQWPRRGWVASDAQQRTALQFLAWSCPMFRKPTLESCLKQLGDQLLDNEALKAAMISRNEAGDVVITLVEGIEESHKVKFGHIDRRSRMLIPHANACAPNVPGRRYRRLEGLLGWRPSRSCP